MYFIQAVGGGPIKIGTTIRLSVRLKAIERDQGKRLLVLGVTDGSYAEEAALHLKFKELWFEDEWFHPWPDILNFVETECRPWDGIDEAGPMSVVKVDSDVLRDARIVCAITGDGLSEYLSDLIRPLVMRDKEAAIEREAPPDR